MTVTNVANSDAQSTYKTREAVQINQATFDGSEIGAAMVMGIFEIEDDCIVAWGDYFDAKNAEKWAISVDTASVQVTRTPTHLIA